MDENEAEGKGHRLNLIIQSHWNWVHYTLINQNLHFDKDYYKPPMII